jgi:hypothetical protein
MRASLTVVVFIRFEAYMATKFCQVLLHDQLCGNGVSA